MRLAPNDTDGWLQAAEHADLIWLESPSNPLLQVADLPAILSQPRKPGAVAVVDNTFATPLGQQPLELGADLVLHSATKYLGGRSDLQRSTSRCTPTRPISIGHEQGPLSGWRTRP